MNLNTIKNWFKTGSKPTQQHFWDTFDSFRHKDDKVLVAEVDGIDGLLLQKADASVVNSHLTTDDAHAVLFDSKADKVEGKELSTNDFTDDYKQKIDNAKIYPYNALQVFKNSTNTNNAQLEIGDYCIGFVEGEFINAKYVGNNPLLLNSFEL